MKAPRFRTAIIIMSASVVVFYALGSSLVYNGVAKYAKEAKAAYGGDATEALIALLEDESASFEKRNSAIWALGQIGDKRALPVLQKLDTNEIQDPPYDSTSYIVQYSVEKAMKQINGFTLTKWIYRRL